MSEDITFDPVLVLSRLLRRHATLVTAPHGCVLIANPEGTSLTIEYGMGIMEPYVGRIIQADDGVAGHVLSTQQPQFIPDYLAWSQAYRRLIPTTRERFNCVSGTPVFRNGKVWAVLSFIWESVEPTQGAEMLPYLTEMSQSATALIHSLEQEQTSLPEMPLTKQPIPPVTPGDYIAAAL